MIVLYLALKFHKTLLSLDNTLIVALENMGKYKQWNGLLEWNTGLGYWTELFSFFGQVSLEALLFKNIPVGTTATDNNCIGHYTDDCMMIVVYCSAFSDV